MVDAAGRGAAAAEPAGDAQMERAHRLFSEGDLEAAEEAYERALDLGADAAEVHHRLGRIHLCRDRLEDAFDSLQLALHLRPQHAEAQADLALLHAKSGDAAAASAAAGDAEAHLVSAAGWGSVAQAYRVIGDFPASARCYEKALAADPNSAMLAAQWGYALFLGGEYAAARLAYERALTIAPDHVAAIHNLGLLELETGHPQAALICFERACRIPSPESLSAKAHALRDLGRLPEACALYEAVLARHPGFGDARLNLAYARLMAGDLEQGWAQHERRFEASNTALPDHGLPRWDGEPLGDRGVIVSTEQGLGDSIMFASCIPEVLQRSTYSVLECDSRLTDLFARSFPRMRVRPRGGSGMQSESRRCGFHIPIGSLPRLFRRSLSDFPRQPYLRVDPVMEDRWRGAFPASKPRIGIAWRGGSLRTRRVQRSIPLAAWHGLLRTPGPRFFALQHGEHAQEARKLAGEQKLDLVDCGHLTHDMDQLAALVKTLDLVITVDNTLAHLAGALGVPTWVLLCASPEWRWQFERDASPWYASLRLLRQALPGQWEPVMRVLCDDLARWATGRSALSSPPN
jgi:tetratricopeptide (TPR) repeat protein